MTEEQLRSMTEQQIRARFRCAPAYYLQAKLENKRALERLAKQSAPDAESRCQAALAGQSRWRAAHSEPEGPEVALREPASLDVALPGFEILDAALAESDDPNARPAQHVTPDPEHTQQAILEAALEDYSNWPLLPAAESATELDPAPEPETESDLERMLELVLESEPELRVVLQSEPELRLVPESQPEIAPQPVPDNVTRADFGHRAPRTVRVVSVVMDRKRPNMVRGVGETTRRAS